MNGFVENVDKSLKIAYRIYGSGDEVIIGFHGFGHPKEDFSLIAEHIPQHQRLIAVDVPGHGESFFHPKREKNEPISKQEWRDLIVQICKNEDVKAFHLCGYSLGGRMSLVTLEVLPEMVLSATLFSPDGLMKSTLYKFGNENWVGRKLLHFALDHGHHSIKIVTLVGKLRLVPMTKVNFVKYQLENHDRLSKVKSVWSALSLCWPDFEKIFNENFQLKKLVIAFGKHDPIIPPHHGKALDLYKKNYPIFIELLPLGHRTLKKEGIEYLKERGYWPPSSS
ncbi:MAG: alpha/beta hydrolase [Flavobacteriales bacterium]|jgi:pimeloyl-ACP methyl ester carboxylesterase